MEFKVWNDFREEDNEIFFYDRFFLPPIFNRFLESEL